MSSHLPAESTLEQLSVADQLELIRMISDSETSVDTSSGIPDWHRSELIQRRAVAEFLARRRAVAMSPTS